MILNNLFSFVHSLIYISTARYANTEAYIISRNTGRELYT